MFDELRQLAQHCGVDLDYRDVFGNDHETSDDVLRELLVALGALPEQGADPVLALTEWENARWLRLLPSVQVICVREPINVSVVLPEELVGRRLAWRLTEEEGNSQTEALSYTEPQAHGERHIDDVRYLSFTLVLSVRPPLGYHRLELVDEGRTVAAMALIIVPDTCYRPAAIGEDGRVWGPAVQLYALRSQRNWGIGDFSDLRLLTEQWAEQGANIVGINPLHAMFLSNPDASSPYSPSSRRFLNVLYLDVEAVEDYVEDQSVREQVSGAEFQLRLQTLRDTELVDYQGVAAAKLFVLEQLYGHFRRRHLERDTERARAFRQFQRHGGTTLRDYALYEALYEHCHTQDPDAWSWMQWPEAYRDPGSAAVTQFGREHAERIEFYEYLQWQAELQLSRVADRLRELDLGVGLYLDLAVSVDGGGVDVWRSQSLYVDGVNVGAPPDDYNRGGQDWGLPPYNPQRLQQSAYAPFIGVLRENMQHAGALRIDHVMGLMRLFWIPHGRGAVEGSYVHYGFDEMLGIVALESHRNRCLVIGEDLGTVPEEVREGMARTHMLSYRLLYFEKDEQGACKPPDQYPAEALAAVATHDLPTLAGFWEGHDIILRTRLGLYDSEQVRIAQVLNRGGDRAALLLALEREGLLPAGATEEPVSLPEVTEEFTRNVHVFLARSRAEVMMVQPEDVLRTIEQVNLPGSLDDMHPNWWRKLILPLEQWPQHAPFLRLTAALADVRPGGRRPSPSHVRLKIPRATYRLQLNNHFTIRDATALVPYLDRLGVSHIYCSPYLKARPGSQHGYDIIDHNAYNPEIGTPEDFEAFADALAAHGMGQILDIVPNHMGVMGADNQWWLDVLENGPASIHADYFDIDWRPAKAELRGKVLLPTLGGRYGEVLERGELALTFDRSEGTFSVYYYEHRMPIAPESYPSLLGRQLDALELRLGAQDPHLLELQSLMTAFGNLPRRNETAANKVLERHRDLQLHKQRLARLCQEAPEIARHIDESVQDFRGEPGNPASFDALHRLLEAQPYRLAHWQVAADEINYRRFFDIHDLAGLRMEDSRVFEATHQLILRLVGEGLVDGLRVDHPDGLYDPHGYFLELQERAGGVQGESGTALYLLVEKILALNETLPKEWLVHGTTGYDFMNQLNGVFVDGRAERNIQRFYAAFTGQRLPYDELVYKCKRLIMKYALSSELNVLSNELNRMSEEDRHTRDFTLNRLRMALAEFVAWLPVYRTYERDGHIGEADQCFIAQALRRAREDSRAEEVAVFEFLESMLLHEAPASEASTHRASRFAMRLQQYTGPVMAKGVEDTALYRYFPLASLNEVGGEPDHFGFSVADFHAANQMRQEHWPHAMLASSTHDNKRSEDVRARINVLSELPREWRAAVREWAAIAARLKPTVEGAPAPDHNDEYLLYQTLIGAWPLGMERAEPDFIERIHGYMQKAVREAKRHSSWINQNPEYEAALDTFIDRLLEMPEFVEGFLPLQRRVARLGLYNSLSQTLLKLTAPGVPDIYQGNEFWDFSLVDPDNRREVNYTARQQSLEAMDSELAAPPQPKYAQQLLDTLEDGYSKLFVIRQALGLRRRHENLFRDGDYLPLASSGPQGEYLCVFSRRLDETIAITIAPRLYASLSGMPDRPPIGEAAWTETEIELPANCDADSFMNVLTGERVEVARQNGRCSLRVSEVLAGFPVALLLGSL